MKVTIPTQEFPAIVRRAIRFHYGQAGLANREECRDWFEENGRSADSDIVDELIEACPEWDDRRD